MSFKKPDYFHLVTDIVREKLTQWSVNVLLAGFSGPVDNAGWPITGEEEKTSWRRCQRVAEVFREKKLGNMDRAPRAADLMEFSVLAKLLGHEGE
jgi:hypothetical protein